MGEGNIKIKGLVFSTDGGQTYRELTIKHFPSESCKFGDLAEVYYIEPHRTFACEPRYPKHIRKRYHSPKRRYTEMIKLIRKGGITNDTNRTTKNLEK